MDAAEVRAWLDSHLDREAVVNASAPPPPSLDRMRELMRYMAEPQHQYPVIHLTGTNGKTSTARIAARILAEAGLTVGTYTSPHLHDVGERITRNGEPIPADELTEVLAAIAATEPLLSGTLSRFEILTAAAYRWFADVAVDVAVVEVGMLGQWDATNIADGQVAVVTNVGPDHLDYAGTIENVAREKAGIVKEGSTLVLGEVDPAFAAVFTATPAATVWRRDEDFACVGNDIAHGGRVVTIRTPSARYDPYFLSLHGAHQGDNAATALVAVEAFLGQAVAGAIVEEAFASVTSPGRLEVVGRRPLVVLDGAHNTPAAEAVAATLVDEFGDADPWTVVLGVLRPHDVADLLAALEPLRIGAVVATAPLESPRAIPAEEVAAAAERAGFDVTVEQSVGAAVRAAIGGAGRDGRVLVTGSLRTVAAARVALVS
ncbi:MAG TPA: Mur ligase family protein [Acidimicrobiales bacterium]